MPRITTITGNFKVTSSIKLDGSSASLAAPSALSLIANGVTTNGTYWIKPNGYSGSAFQIYCDLTGSASGIGTGGWMRIVHAADYYSQAAALGNSGNGNTGDGIFYGGNFSFALPDSAIDSLLSNTTETRARFESYGKGSVGWTYEGTSYMGAKAWNNSTHRGSSTTDQSNLIVGGSLKPSSISYAFPNGGGGITNFNNAGTDPTDINDDVWRQSILYIREFGTRSFLPIRGVYAADVDTVAEERYWPFNSGVGSYYWVK